VSNRSILGTRWQFQKKHVTTSPDEDIKDKIFWRNGLFSQKPRRKHVKQCFHNVSHSQPTAGKTQTTAKIAKL